MADERFEHAGRWVRVRYLVGAETVLCAIVDTGEGDIAAVLNTQWGRSSVVRHVIAHLDVGVLGAVVCKPGCMVV